MAAVGDVQEAFAVGGVGLVDEAAEFGGEEERGGDGVHADGLGALLGGAAEEFGHVEAVVEGEVLLDEGDAGAGGEVTEVMFAGAAGEFVEVGLGEGDGLVGGADDGEVVAAEDDGAEAEVVLFAEMALIGGAGGADGGVVELLGEALPVVVVGWAVLESHERLAEVVAVGVDDGDEGLFILFIGDAAIGDAADVVGEGV